MNITKTTHNLLIKIEQGLRGYVRMKGEQPLHQKWVNWLCREKRSVENRRLRLWTFGDDCDVFWKNDASIDSAGVSDVDVGWSRDDAAVGMA